MKTTVITSSVNRKTKLQRLLTNLTTQTLLPDEIIIVEAGNSIWTKEDLPAALENKITIFHAPGESLSASRDRGRKAALGDVLIYLDDDVIAPPTYIEHALRHLAKHSEVMAVGGVYDDESTLTRRSWSTAIGRLLGIYGDGTKNRILSTGWADYVRGNHADKTTDAEWLFGCNWVIRANAFEHPDVNIEVKLAAWSFLEDVILGYRLTNAYGPCMRVLPELRVIHDSSISAGNVSTATLRMRILYRYIFWRDNLSNGNPIRTAGFWLGMFANLLLILKQEPRYWVISEHVKTYKFNLQHRGMSLETANEYIFS